MHNPGKSLANRALVPTVAVVLFAANSSLFAQRPKISPNGVVNAASLVGTVDGEASLVGGSIFSIFGENLSACEQHATTSPLPLSLCGTSVTVAGVAAPLFFASTGQVNFQVPAFVSSQVGKRLPVVVLNGAGASDPMFALVEQSAPGIFSQDGSGCGHGAIQNVNADGRVALNTPENSASPGSFVVIYGTGMGPLYSPPQDGYPAPTEPLSRLDLPGVLLHLQGFVWLDWITPSWSGLAPGLIGVDQVNAYLRENAPEGCKVPVRLGGGTSDSPPLTMSIRRGGGPCLDTRKVSFSTVAWQKTVTTSPETPGGAVTAQFTASFASAPEDLALVGADPPDPPSPQCRCSGIGTAQPPKCNGAGLTSLTAGSLTLDGLPAGPVILPAPSAAVDPEYSMALSPDSLNGGTLAVRADGGADIGGFATSTTMPPPIALTTSLGPGTVIDNHSPFSVEWTGGSPDALVAMRLVANASDRVYGRQCTCQVLASEGRVRLPLTPNLRMELVLGTYVETENAEVVVTVTPRTSKGTRFTAPGLTRGGRHEWTYEYRFRGLRIR